jgi:Ca2+-binding RTX toxin-like protein
MATVNGTKLADTLYGTSTADTINGYAGNDTLKGFGGADRLDGGAGVDTAFYDDSPVAVGVNLASGLGFGGTAEGDTLINIENLYGSSFNDTLIGNDAANTFYGLTGNDLLKGGGGADRLEGGAGNDTLKGGGGADALVGGAGIDTADYSESLAGVRVHLGINQAFLGDAQGDRFSSIENVSGSSLADYLEGDAYANVLRGQDGDDELWGGYGNDTLEGGAGYDRLNGQSGRDTLIGGMNSDVYYVDDAGDTVVERIGEGNDSVYTIVNYALTPGAEIEYLSIQNLFDTTAINLTGNEFANQIVGNQGDNIIAGGAGSDRLYGNGGRDRFLFDTPLNAATNVDVIGDFDVAQDTILIENRIFDAFAAGTLAEERFVIGPAALEANDTLIYNPANGALLYDVDGSGPGAAIQFARLAGNLALTTDDFLIV